MFERSDIHADSNRVGHHVLGAGAAQIRPGRRSTMAFHSVRA
jgi:hypothetical protein